MESGALVVDTFSRLGLEARLLDASTEWAADVVLEPDGVKIRLQVTRRSLVSAEAAERLLTETNSAGGALFVVADRVTEEARKVLVSRRAGYLDLRGHIALRTDRLVIDRNIEPLQRSRGRSTALAGQAGLEVALALLMQPTRSVAVRELARSLERSPSTVSEILSALRREGLIDETNAVPDHELFWVVAHRWPTRRTYLAQLPPTGDVSLTLALKLGLRDVEHESGWALTDSAAAAAYGAPLAFRSGQPLDFFVPGPHTVRRALTLLGETKSASQAAASVRATPVPAIVRQRVDLPANSTEWPLVHPVVAALDLAQDVGRGREILNDWKLESEWGTRVW